MTLLVRGDEIPSPWINIDTLSRFESSKALLWVTLLSGGDDVHFRGLVLGHQTVQLRHLVTLLSEGDDVARDVFLLGSKMGTLGEMRRVLLV
ncbi:MAG: hypothetical protein Q4G30_06380 [Actinomycetaceae bacterium]|nr:hypothetical protein [Actinomycetaceae bacterium]